MAIQIQSFEISTTTFRHVVGVDAVRALHLRNVRSRFATEAWRGSAYLEGPITWPSLLFECSTDGDANESVSLYRLRLDGAGRLTALVAPMWLEVGKPIEPEAFWPDGQVINAAAVTSSIATRRLFWRKTCAFIEHVLEGGLVDADGNTLGFSHIRFPSVAEGDPIQHCWTNDGGIFGQVAKFDVTFDTNGLAVKTGGWLSVDPDPERERGQYA